MSKNQIEASKIEAAAQTIDQTIEQISAADQAAKIEAIFIADFMPLLTFEAAKIEDAKLASDEAAAKLASDEAAAKLAADPTALDYPALIAAALTIGDFAGVAKLAALAKLQAAKNANSQPSASALMQADLSKAAANLDHIEAKYRPLINLMSNIMTAASPIFAEMDAARSAYAASQIAFNNPAKKAKGLSIAGAAKLSPANNNAGGILGDMIAFIRDAGSEGAKKADIVNMSLVQHPLDKDGLPATEESRGRSLDQMTYKDQYQVCKKADNKSLYIIG